jgi:hypothetical protein
LSAPSELTACPAAVAPAIVVPRRKRCRLRKRKRFRELAKYSWASTGPQVVNIRA